MFGSYGSTLRLRAGSVDERAAVIGAQGWVHGRVSESVGEVILSEAKEP